MITVPEHPLHFVGRQQTSGEVDYVQDGRLHQGANAPSVLVGSENDLSLLNEHYHPGPISCVIYTRDQPDYQHEPPRKCPHSSPQTLKN